jgi:hypothetical protein
MQSVRACVQKATIALVVPLTLRNLLVQQGLLDKNLDLAVSRIVVKLLMEQHVQLQDTVYLSHVRPDIIVLKVQHHDRNIHAVGQMFFVLKDRLNQHLSLMGTTLSMTKHLVM